MTIMLLEKLKKELIVNEFDVLTMLDELLILIVDRRRPSVSNKTSKK